MCRSTVFHINCYSNQKVILHIYFLLILKAVGFINTSATKMHRKSMELEIHPPFFFKISEITF